VASLFVSFTHRVSPLSYVPPSCFCSIVFCFYFFLLILPPPISTLFPYTTLFRSEAFYDNPNALRDYFRDIGRMVLAAEGRKNHKIEGAGQQECCVRERIPLAA